MKTHRKIDFLPIFYQIFQELCHSTQLLKITIFHKNFRFARESFRLPLEPVTKSSIFWFIVVSNFSCLERSTGIIRGASRRMGSSVGGEKAVTSPSEIGKNVVEILCYLPEVYTFRKESELQ